MKRTEWDNDIGIHRKMFAISKRIEAIEMRLKEADERFCTHLVEHKHKPEQELEG